MASPVRNWTISKLVSFVMQHNVSRHSQVCNQETERVEGPVNHVIHWWIWDFFYNLSDLDMATSKIKCSGPENCLC